MSGSGWYRGFVLGMFVAGFILGVGAVATRNDATTLTSPSVIMAVEFVASGLMAGLYMVFHEIW